MAELLIVYHSLTGGSRQMAEAAAEAAREETPTVLKTAREAGPDDLLNADGYLFCAPENLAAIAGVMKDFFDRCYYPLLEGAQGLPYALYIRAGHDGTGTRRGVETIVTGLRWRAIHEPLICRGEWREDFVDSCHELGMLVAAGLGLGVF